MGKIEQPPVLQKRTSWAASPGIHRGVDNADYHADRNAVSSTALKRMLQSPAHFRASQLKPRKETLAQAFGSAVHSMLLEPHLFEYQYRVEPAVGTATDTRNEKCETISQAVPEQMLLSQQQHDEILAMRGSANKHAAIRQMLISGEAETTFCWTDRETGVLLKARTDWIQFETCIWDVKTAADASRTGFSRACANYDYHFSCAMYREGVHALTGRWLPFRFVVLEKGFPHACAVYEASASFIKRGEEDFRIALRKFAQCQAADDWPGYQCDKIEAIDLPAWK